MLKDRFSALSKPELRVFWGVLLLTTFLSVFAIARLDTLREAPNSQTTLVNAIPFGLALVSFLSAGLVFAGRRESGSWALLLGSFAGLLLGVSQAEGYAIPSALILLAITLFVPVQLLTEGRRAAALGTGIAGTIAIILVDTFWPYPRVPALAGDVLLAGSASIVLGTIILAAVIYQYRTLSIRPKLLLFAVGTGLISIILVASLTTYLTQRELERQTREGLVAAAQHTMDEIDASVTSGKYRLVSDAQIPAIIAYLKLAPEEREANREQMVALLNALAHSDLINIGSYALLDENGVDIADTYVKDMGVDKSDRDYFITPLTKGFTYVSPVRFSPTSPDRAFYISTPVLEKGKILGVLRVRIRASFLNQILQNNTGFAGEGSYALLLDDYDMVIAHGVNNDWVSHTLVQPDQTTIQQLISENRVDESISLEKLSLDLPDFTQSLNTIGINRLFFSSTDGPWGTPVEVGVATSITMPWKIAYVEPQAAAFQTIVQQRRTITLTALLAAILVALAGFAVGGTITRPILSLAATAEQIAAGDLSARAHVKTGDEIHALAVAFNRMADRLKDTLGGLERRVLERTHDVEMARVLSERRAQELQAISDISRVISSEQRLEILFSLITRLVSEKFDFYHVGIFTVDDTRQYAVLQASNSQGGQQMLARGHRLEVGHTGLVGYVAKTGEARIALDVGEDAIYFDNPDLPKTRSEMALPLRVHGETIGVLDIQSTEPGVFTESDAKTLSILADQIAIAISNARLFGQNKQALEELQSLYNQYLRQEWKTFIQNKPTMGYVYSIGSGRSLEVPLESEDIQQALQAGKVVTLGKRDRSLPIMAIPVQLRGQTIGVLHIQAPNKSRTWNQDEIKLAQAIADRLALALDNARLLFVSQRQTAKEQKVGEVTAKIGASINMRNVLQTAVEELGRALPGSEVIIQFQSNGKRDA